MFDGVLRLMRECVVDGKLIFPFYSLAALDQDLLNRDDVRHCILSGEIVERQWDRNYNEYKYVIAGSVEDGREIEVVAKLRQIGDTVIITVYCVY